MRLTTLPIRSFAVAIFLTIACGPGRMVSQAQAAFSTTTCATIRAAVSAYGVPAALAWAKRNGWSRAQIEEAKRCL